MSGLMRPSSGNPTDAGGLRGTGDRRPAAKTSPRWRMSAVGNGEHHTGQVIGLLHPGEMGAAVGRCLAGRGHEVLWAGEGRGPDTAARAKAAGLADAGT